MNINLIVAAILVGGIALGFITIQRAQIKSLEDKMVTQNVQLRACGARLNNIIRDLESDHEIDRLPDDALTDVPPHWLQPTGED